MRRLNIGCGIYPLDGYVNIDQDRAVEPDIVAQVPPIPGADESVDEIVACHFLEHLDFPEALAFLVECHRVLVMGGRLLIVVPDTKEIMRRWVNQSLDMVAYPNERTWWDIRDLDHICALFLYSTVQPSPHRWAWYKDTLARAMGRCGFAQFHEIDRFRDPRLGSGAWYQVGIEGRKTMACRVCHRALKEGSICPECWAEEQRQKEEEERNAEETRESPGEQRAGDSEECDD